MSRIAVQTAVFTGIVGADIEAFVTATFLSGWF